jgi:hypothetical protein
MDQRTPELREASTARIELFHKAWADEKQMIADNNDGQQIYGSGDASSFSIKWPNSWFTEVRVLLSRNLKDVARDKATIGATIGQGIMLMILNGFIFFRMPLTYAGSMDRLGLFFFICVNQTFGVVMPTLSVFPDQRRIIKRERSAGSYRSTSAYIAKAISTLPLTLAGALLLAVPIYWMAGLQADVGRYFTFIVIIVIHSLTAK